MDCARCRHNDLLSFRPPQVCHRHCDNGNGSAIFALKLKLLKRRVKETLPRVRPVKIERERERAEEVFDRPINRSEVTTMQWASMSLPPLPIAECYKQANLDANAFSDPCLLIEKNMKSCKIRGRTTISNSTRGRRASMESHSYTFIHYLCIFFTFMFHLFSS